MRNTINNQEARALREALSSTYRASAAIGRAVRLLGSSGRDDLFLEGTKHHLAVIDAATDLHDWILGELLPHRPGK